jgi:hypothetical protein
MTIQPDARECPGGGVVETPVTSITLGPRIAAGTVKKVRPQRVRPLHRVLLSPWSTGVSVVIVALALVLPPDGAGIPLCWFQAATGLPCPGCGLTRSVSSIAHLHVGESFSYHPFGPLVLALALFLVGTLIAGKKRRVRLVRWLARRDRVLRPVYLGLVAAFIAFGVLRLIAAVIDPSIAAHL